MILRHLPRKRISLKQWFAVTLICVAPTSPRSSLPGLLPRSRRHRLVPLTPCRKNIQIGGLAAEEEGPAKDFRHQRGYLLCRG